MIKINDLAFFLIALSAIAYLWFGGTQFMGVHLPPIIAAVGIYVALTVMFLKTKISISPTAKAILIVSFLLISWMFVREFLAGTELALAMKVIGGRILVGVIIAFSIWFLTTELWHLRFVTYVLIAAITVSAVVGIGQYFIGGPFIRLWELTGGYLPKLWEVHLGYIAGLAAYSIPFAYQLCTSVPLVFGLCIFRSVWCRGTLFAIFLLLFLSLFLTQARSAVIGALIGIAMILWIRRRGWKLGSVLLFLIIGALAYLLYGMYVTPRMITFTEFSAQARPPLFLVALWTGFTHPFGTGRVAYTEVASGFYGSVQELPSAEAVFEYTAHNQFLNMLGYYGIPGLVLVIIFYVFLFRLFGIGEAVSLNAGFLNGMRAGLLAGFASYLINSCFHNAGPFIGDPVNWYFIGLALAANKLAISSPSRGKK